ncbi:hypothetical protein L0128_22735 [candidate division KSB1 bacterium]|nr:hypothetical protein [candidate division KSB1 bacterium]
MMRQVIILFIWGLCSTRIIAQGYDHWNFLRYSAVMANDSLKVRVEDNAPVNKPHSIIFKGQSTLIERPMNGVVDAGATYEASVPAPIADTSFLGLRLVDSNRVHLIPPYFKGSEMPALSELIQMSSDVAGDDLFKLNFLDIAADFVACSREKLFYGLRNAGGGFPVMEGFTFYSYLGAIINPDDQSEKPIVFCLIYTINQPGMITPGLYRIMGSGLGDLIKIGEIETRIALNENLIIMSCRLKDLYNDPYFKAWYQPENPRFSIAAITQRISLVEGTKEADRSSGATLYPRALPIGPFTNQLPQLSNAQVTQVEGENLLEIRYFDPNTNFPLTAEVIFDDETTHRYLLFPLTSLSLKPKICRRQIKSSK